MLRKTFETPVIFSVRGFAFPRKKFRQIKALLDCMKNIAEKYKIDPSQIPILWASAKGAIPIVGLTKVTHAKKLFMAMDVSLTEEEVNVLTKEAKKTGIRQQGSWEPQ